MVNRDRVMYLAVYPLLSQRLQKVIALRVAQNKEMPDRLGPVGNGWHAEAVKTRQTGDIGAGNLLSCLIPSVEIRLLYSQYRCL